MADITPVHINATITDHIADCGNPTPLVDQKLFQINGSTYALLYNWEDWSPARPLYEVSEQIGIWKRDNTTGVWSIIGAKENRFSTSYYEFSAAYDGVNSIYVAYNLPTPSVSGEEPPSGGLTQNDANKLCIGKFNASNDTYTVFLYKNPSAVTAANSDCMEGGTDPRPFAPESCPQVMYRSDGKLVIGFAHNKYFKTVASHVDRHDILYTIFDTANASGGYTALARLSTGFDNNANPAIYPQYDCQLKSWTIDSNDKIHAIFSVTRYDEGNPLPIWTKLYYRTLDSSGVLSDVQQITDSKVAIVGGQEQWNSFYGTVLWGNKLIVGITYGGAGGTTPKAILWADISATTPTWAVEDLPDQTIWNHSPVVVSNRCFVVGFGYVSSPRQRSIKRVEWKGTTGDWEDSEILHDDTAYPVNTGPIEPSSQMFADLSTIGLSDGSIAIVWNQYVYIGGTYDSDDYLAHYLQTPAVTSNIAGDWELWEILKPDIVQVLPIARRFDQLGPEELFRYGKIKQFEYRVLALKSGETSLTIPYEIFFNDNTSFSSAITVIQGKEASYFIGIPKGTAGAIVRIEFGPTTFDFHRYYVRLQCMKSGRDTELEWVTLLGLEAQQ